jgi:hypothetical protein
MLHLCHAVLKATSQGHGTTWQGHGISISQPDSMWAIRPRSASSGYHTEFHKCCHQKHTNPKFVYF